MLMPEFQTFDAVVVGAGIVGAACASELAAAGMRVAICEASDAVGGGATAAGMGHIAVMDDSEAQFTLTSYSQKLWNDLARELPPETEYLSCGSLWIAADKEELAEVHRKYGYYSSRGIQVEVLDERQLAEAEPYLRPGLAGALLMSGDSVCYAPAVAALLVKRALRRGSRLLLNTRVVRISNTGVETAGGLRLSAGATILATGTAVDELAPGSQVVPRKGHLIITDRYPGFVRHQLIELGYLKSAHATTADSVAFNAQPRITGQVLIGSSRQYGNFDRSVDGDMLARMLARAVAYIPVLERMSAIRSWTGFRAATPDKLPLIGKHPGLDNVYIASGHEGLGISTALATARLIADELHNRPSAIPREPYAPTREYAAHA
jgi:glycine/D-amino acid oxidase-like deaminating enzyme